MLIGKLTGVLLAVASITLLGAAMASPASAVTFTLTSQACEGGTLEAYCYEKPDKLQCSLPPEKVTSRCELVGEQSFTVAGGQVLFTVLTLGHTITCARSSGSGTILQPEPLNPTGPGTDIHGRLQYSGCLLTAGPTRTCVVNTENETTELEGKLINGREFELKPRTAAEFLTITYSNKGSETCSVRGPHTVTGTEDVEIVNPGTPSETEELRAIGEGTLKFFSDPADLTQDDTLTFTGLKDLPYVSKVA